jgi:hypothetical protein
MLRQILYLLLFVTVFISCNETSKQTNNTKKDTSSITKVDTSIINSNSYKNEQDYLKRKRVLCNRLALYDIEKGTDYFELRIWLIPSLWHPSILYILKAKDTTWTLFHYQFYTLRGTGLNHYMDSPLVDSVIMESVRPQKTNWQTYINNLQLDSLWNLQTESSIKGKTFRMLDGHRYILEFSDKGKYKYMFYTTPEYFQDKDINHKKFTEFKKRLVNPIIYRGMHNP